MNRVVVAVLAAALLAGCASQGSPAPWLGQRGMLQSGSCEPLTGEQELVLNLARDMAESGRMHAALANLERLPDDLPQARLHKARLLRVLGQADAEPLYRGLLGTCLAADGRHGLGQIEVARQNYSQALEHIRLAVSLSPANAAMRNDLGVVHLNLRQWSEARFELITAMQLSERETRAAENLLTLLIYEDQWQQARELVMAQGLGPAQFREAQQRAQRLIGEDRLQVGRAADGPEPRQTVQSGPDAEGIGPRAMTGSTGAVGGVRYVQPVGVRPIEPVAGIERVLLQSRETGYE